MISADNVKLKEISSVASQVSSRCNATVSRMESLCERAEEVLAPVTFQAEPKDKKCVASSKETYPPLFDDLREHIEKIDISINRLFDLLNRVAL